MLHQKINEPVKYSYFAIWRMHLLSCTKVDTYLQL